MKVLDIPQGSEAWLDARAKYRCASEAPIIMGASPHMTRNQMIHAKKTMQDREFADFVQKYVIDKGHEVEASTRPLVEADIGEDLFPVVGVDDSDVYLASFDGVTMDGTLIWENKLFNKELFAKASKADISIDHMWQIEHQLLVSGASQAIYTVSDGTPEGKVSLKYQSSPALRQQLIRGWDQFDADVEAYEPVAQKAEAVPVPAKTLPAITYRLNGLALTSNLDEYKNAALQLVEDSKQQLQTDQDFADREALIKAFKAAEERIKVIKEQVVGEIKDVAAFTNDLTDISGLIRQARLNSEKKVEERKEEIRLGIERGAAAAFAEHVSAINKRLATSKVQLPKIEANFFAVMKGKKTVASLQNAADTLLSQLKIQANEIAEKMETNIRTLRQYGDYEFLFADVQQLVMKAADDLVAVIKARIADHKETERKKEEQIRLDEKARIEREAAEKKSEPVVEPAAPVQQQAQAIQPGAGGPATAAKTGTTGKGGGGTGALPRRPADTEIVDVLVKHYNRDRNTVITWLKNFNAELAA